MDDANARSSGSMSFERRSASSGGPDSSTCDSITGGSPIRQTRSQTVKPRIQNLLQEHCLYTEAQPPSPAPHAMLEARARLFCLATSLMKDSRAPKEPCRTVSRDPRCVKRRKESQTQRVPDSNTRTSSALTCYGVYIEVWLGFRDV